jgi:hypothetical protein
MDRNRDVRVCAVPDRGAFRDAGSPPGVVTARKDDTRTFGAQDPRETKGNVEVVLSFGVAAARLASAHVARLLQRTGIHQSVDLGRMSEVGAVMPWIDSNHPVAKPTAGADRPGGGCDRDRRNTQW